MNKYIDINIEIPYCTHGARIKSEEFKGLTEDEKKKKIQEIARDLAFEVFDYNVNVEDK